MAEFVEQRARCHLAKLVYVEPHANRARDA
jgi:hypothetical protein